MKIAVNFFQVARMVQNFDWHACEFITAVSENSRKPGVDVQNSSVAVEDGEEIRRGIQEDL